MRYSLFALLLCGALFGDEPLPPDQMAKGVALGRQFQTRKEFIEKGLKPNKVQLASAWAKDGISKYVTFYRDYHVAAARVVDATQRLREVSDRDLADIPRTGLLFANLELHARGILPIRRLNNRFAGGGVHMVLQIDGVNIQPEKEGFVPKPEKATCVGQYYTYSVFAVYNFALASGGISQYTYDCTERQNKFSLEYGFRLTPEQMKKKATVIIADAEGNRSSEKVDLASLQ